MNKLNDQIHNKHDDHKRLSIDTFKEMDKKIFDLVEFLYKDDTDDAAEEEVVEVLPEPAAAAGKKNPLFQNLMSAMGGAIGELVKKEEKKLSK